LSSRVKASLKNLQRIIAIEMKHEK
jgi:hypothetical protein